MDLGLRGRAAIVEASSEGIGKAIAFALASEGSDLLICARRPGPLDETAEVIRTATGVRVAAVAADVTDEHAAKDLVARALGEYGRLDICVTNAGGPPSKSFSDASAEDWRRAVDLNLLSVVWLAREALPVMQRAGWGRFITLTSVSVKQPLSGLILSNSVRTAVNGLVRSLCNEYGATGVTVNNVCPGFTATERLRELAGKLGPGAEQEWIERIPARRLATPEEVGDLVAFLCSERAAYINGESIAIDGGLAQAYR